MTRTLLLRIWVVIRISVAVRIAVAVPISVVVRISVAVRLLVTLRIFVAILSVVSLDCRLGLPAVVSNCYNFCILICVDILHWRVDDVIFVDGFLSLFALLRPWCPSVCWRLRWNVFRYTVRRSYSCNIHQHCSMAGAQQ